jgi:integrase/recombinase XerD
MAQQLAVKTYFSNTTNRTYNLAERGVGVRVLMALGGHGNMATTLRYIDLCTTTLKVAVDLV